MGVVSRARNANLKLSIQDVLGSKSVVHLSQLANRLPSSVPTEMHEEEQTEQPFAVSPIQSVYLRSAVKHDGDSRFNQSFALGVSRHVGIDTIKLAVDSVVNRHDMLRVRLARTPNGKWMQRIAEVSLPSHVCKLLENLSDMEIDGVFNIPLS
jgi:hypothetical protein